MLRRRLATVAAALGLAALLLTLGIAQAGAQEPAPQEPFSVPAGKVGDVVQYDRSQNHVEHGTGVTRQREDREVWTVQGMQDVADQTGRTHSALQIEDTLLPVFATGTGQERDEAWHNFFDASSRELLRLDWNFAFEAGGIPATYCSCAYTAVWPDFGGAASVLGGTLQAVAMAQARTFTTDEALTLTMDSLSDPADPTRRSMYEHRLALGPSGVFGSESVRGLDFSYHVSEGAGSADRYDEWVNETLWFPQGGAYPVRITSRSDAYWADDSERGGATVWSNASLVDLVAGSAPIPWGEGPPLARPPHNPDLQWGGADYPVSGDAWPWPFPIEDAVAAIESDPSLLHFSAWKLQNPGARVIGFARGDRLDGLAPSDVPNWRVHYGVPGGNVLREIVSVQATGSIVRNYERETSGIPLAEDRRVRIDGWGTPMVTLTTVDAAWKAMSMRGEYETGVNFLSWGYAKYRWPHFDPGTMVDYIDYGHQDAGAVPGTEANLYSVVDLYTGNLSWTYSIGREIDYAGTLPARLAPQGQVEAAAAPAANGDVVPALAAVAGASALILLLAAVLPALKQGWMAFFTKVTEPEAIQHALRAQLTQLIRENPGIDPPTLAQMTGAPWSTLNYHLHVLQRSNLVLSTRQGRHLHFFPPSADRAKLSQLGVLANERTRAVYDAVRRAPGLDRVTLARTFRWTPAGALWHLDRLRDNGLVRAEKQGKVVRYFATAQAPSHT